MVRHPGAPRKARSVADFNKCLSFDVGWSRTRDEIGSNEPPNRRGETFCTACEKSLQIYEA